MVVRDEARALEADLRAAVAGGVRFDPGSRALYSTDGSNYRQVPIGVVLPRDVDDVVAVTETCRAHGAPILPRGAGTSLAGQCCNVAVVVDFSKHLNAVLGVDSERRLARVQPGVVCDQLGTAAAAHGLTFGPDPATHGWCTVGGMIGNNACGVHSVMAGKTAENVQELEVLTSDGVRMRVGPTSEEELERLAGSGGRGGEIYAGLRRIRDTYANLIRARFPHIPRRVSGYNLDQLLPENGFQVARALVGTEGTCVTVVEATVRLVSSPPARAMAVLGYPDIQAAADDTVQILSHGPIGLEGMDGRLVEAMRRKGLHSGDLRLLPDGDGWLIVEFGGESAVEAVSKARDFAAAMANRARTEVYEDAPVQRRVWGIRESGLGATAHVPGRPLGWEGWDDAAVPPERLGPYLRDLRALMDRFGYDGPFYGHFGDGCIHTRVDFDLATEEGVVKFRTFVDEAADLVLSYGGSLSGEHGDGQSRAELLPKMFGHELVQAFSEFKSLWDPDRLMNPGKVVDPNPITSNLRLGAGFEPAKPATHFAFAEDGGSLGRAALRCVGVGKCRREEGGLMCPSYVATREERHSTRGRARLLFEMLQGGAIESSWRSEEVLEALDLCLACKGCRTECPTNVDMATYKAEFISHHYEGRLRPRSAYGMGLIQRWARLASKASTLANFLTQTPGLRSGIKRAAGIAPERQIPRFAQESFTKWFRRRQAGVGSRVILWPDTFTNHFEPWIARAGVEVLEAAGFRVEIPGRPLCCGRPLYDFGMLDQAKKQLKEILRELGPDIDSAVPIVGLEPSCVAVFRDELPGLFPNDERAQKLSRRSFLLPEFLESEGFQPPTLERKALVHGHCHHRAVMGFDSEERLLERLGLEFEIPEVGCCGMAGSFGYERGEHYDVSLKVGERALLPAIRAADADTLIVADGFSCREQIRQLTGRKALHAAELVRVALPD
jgi:FAD/FMN-containing dehydrogenase/Fe-S oxidoreductase